MFQRADEVPGVPVESSYDSALAQGHSTGAIPLQEVCPQTLWEMAFPALKNGEWKKAFPVIPSLLIFRQLIYVGGLCYSRPMVRNRPQRR